MSRFMVEENMPIGSPNQVVHHTYCQLIAGDQGHEKIKRD